jgi:hypothetical protein
MSSVYLGRSKRAKGTPAWSVTATRITPSQRRVEPAAGLVGDGEQPHPVEHGLPLQGDRFGVDVLDPLGYP